MLTQTHGLETARNQVKKEKIDVETQLREKVISLESKLDLLQTAELHEKSRLEDLIVSIIVFFSYRNFAKV